VHQQYQGTFLLLQTDAHHNKIIGILKQLKYRLSLRPTCFGSRRNHHQGVISCLAKTTNMIPSFTVYRTLAQQAGMPP